MRWLTRRRHRRALLSPAFTSWVQSVPAHYAPTLR